MKPDSRTIQGSYQINPEVADTLIKITFSTTAAIKDLLQYIGNQESFEDIQLSTLQPVFFGNRENDISFLLDNKLYYFFEHQSTINYNMPLRILFYITQALENLQVSLLKIVYLYQKNYFYQNYMQKQFLPKGMILN